MGLCLHVDSTSEGRVKYYKVSAVYSFRRSGKAPFDNYTTEWQQEFLIIQDNCTPELACAIAGIKIGVDVECKYNTDLMSLNSIKVSVRELTKDDAIDEIHGSFQLPYPDCNLKPEFVWHDHMLDILTEGRPDQHFISPE